MKTPVFEYHRAGSVEEALSLLADRGDEAKVLAGGQSLIPLLSMRLALPTAVIDIGAITDLGAIQEKPGFVSIGAMVRERTCERSSIVARLVPLLSEAAPLIGHVAIRNRGTVCGSVAHADPAAEIPAVVVALGAEVQVMSAQRGARTVAAADFFQGYWTSALADDELLTGVDFPIARSGTGVAFLEAVRRHGDYAMVGACCSIHLEDGLIDEARVVLIGVADTPLRRPEAEQILVGCEATTESIESASEVAATHLAPSSDVHGSGAYRRHVARVLVGRAIAAAVERAKEST